MDFCFSADEIDLRDGAREYLRGSCTPDVLRKLVEEESADLGSWAELVEMGLVGFLVPEEAGGLGMSAHGFALLAEEAGYVALPAPLVDTAGVAAPVLARLGHAAAAEIAAGETCVLTSHPLNPYVNQLLPGDRILQFAAGEVRLTATGAADSQAVESIDPLRRLAKIRVSNAEMLASREQAEACAFAAALRGAVFTSAEMLGLSAAMIDMATAYAKERKQFGAAIGSFQAVKHHLSTAFTKLEFARPVVYRAAASLGADDDRAVVHAAHAKIAACDAAINAAEAAIQVHGGIGYTFEADLHLWMKRAWALAGLWGDRNHHMNVVDRAVFGGKLPLGPASTFQPQQQA